jgi:hypothetical protein
MTLSSNSATSDYLIALLASELSLAKNRINFYNQKFEIPNDQHLFVNIEYKFSRCFASKSQTAEDESIFNEHKIVHMQEHYAVMLFSRNLEAFQKKEQAVMALCSIYARQLSDQYNFRLARIAPIQDLSYLEGAGILYRYEIDVVVLRAYEQTPAVPWFGTFAGNVTIEDGETTTAEFDPTLPA